MIQQRQGYMGTLKPNTQYIYERVDDVVYAREFGAPANERFVVGQKWVPEDQKIGRSMRDRMLEDRMWDGIRELAKTNITLQSELDRVIMLYNLLKQEDTIDWHPV
tara:strand:+ start:26 stop:343 length:318 start_codon:yes stop_codon:yes gene_type:complete